MNAKTNIDKPCPKPGETFELRVGETTKRCLIVSLSGIKVGDDQDIAKTLSDFQLNLRGYGSIPQDGELEAFAQEYFGAEELVGVATGDGPVMFRCAQKGRLISHYVNDELTKTSLWLVICQ